MNNKYIFILIAGLVTAFLIVAAPSTIARAACSDPGDGSIVCDGDNDTVTVDSSDTVPSVSGGGGEDNVTNDGTVTGNVSGDDDNDTITNNGTVNGNLDGGFGANSGDDTITNSGDVDGSVFGQEGNDTITNETGGEIDGTIYGWTGDDVINNAGTAGGIQGGDGEDEITNSGTVGGIDGNDGNDTITNDGTVNGNLDGGFGANSGDDTITNSGTVNGNILGQEGNDTITNEAGGEVDGTIYGWTGDDEINNAGTVDNIDSGPGDDVVTLQDGSDVSGVIDGGEDADNEDVDTLVFDFTTDDEDAFNQFNDDFSSADPEDGNITWLSNVIEWINFEVLQNLVEYINSDPDPDPEPEPEPDLGGGGSGHSSGTTRTGAACFFNDGILLVCRYENGDVAFLLVENNEATLHTYVTSDELNSTQVGESPFDNTNDEGYRLRATHSPEDTFVVELFLPGTGTNDDGTLALTGPDAQPRVYEFSF